MAKKKTEKLPLRMYRPRPDSKEAFWIDFWFRGKRHRVRATEDKDSTAECVMTLNKLVKFKEAGMLPEKDLLDRVRALPPDLRDKLTALGVIKGTVQSSSNPIDEHIAAWKAQMLSDETTPGHAELQAARVTRVVLAVGAMQLSDITAGAVDLAISKFHRFVETVNGRKDLGPISRKSRKYYLGAVNAFFRWMVMAGRAWDNPVANLLLKKNKSTNGITRIRRALSVDEIQVLLAVTDAGKTRYRIGGPERALLYRTAILTGFRASELRDLTAGDFELDGKFVTLRGQFTKNGEDAVQPLHKELVPLLQPLLSGKLPAAPAFKMPSKYNTAEMLRKDLADARKDWISKGLTPKEQKGREQSDFLKAETREGVVDFHSLRGCYATLLSHSGADLKDSMSLMRHSDPTLTMKTYARSYRQPLQEAVDAIPSLNTPKAKPKSKPKVG